MFDDDSTKTLEYTFVESKLSCWRPFYYAHITFAYLIFLSGVFAFITRLHPKLNIVHMWMGRFYIMFMLWGTATSLLIHNAGLPSGVLYSFLWVLTGLCFGWIVITIHQKHRHQLMKMSIFAPYASKGRSSRWRLILDRLLSLKTLHGCLMFTSWINIAGRLFITKVDDDFECYTYPAFKQVTNSKNFNYTLGDPIRYDPQISPEYGATPWAYKEGAWAAQLSLGPFFGAFLIGFIYILITGLTGKSNQKHLEEPTNAAAVGNASTKNEEANANQEAAGQV